MVDDDADLSLYISWTYSSPFTCILVYVIVFYFLATSDQLVRYVSKQYSYQTKNLRGYELHCLHLSVDKS